VKQLVGHTLTVFMGFFAIMNPIANTPIFLGLTSGDTPQAKRRVAASALVSAFLLVAVFAVLGNLIFHLFGISLPAFRVAGGILVALIGYQMLHGEQSKVHQPTREDRTSSLEAAMSVAITPLAIPILAGPGTIATAMSFAADGGVAGIMITITAFAVLCLLSYLFFVSGERLVTYLGQSGLNVVTRIMGLILAVIGVQMLIDGISGAVELAQHAK